VVPDHSFRSRSAPRPERAPRLAAHGWDIDILTEQEESERRQAEFENRTKMFIEALDVDEVVGQLLASKVSIGRGTCLIDREGNRRRSKVRRGHRDRIADRAQDYLARIEGEYDAKRKELGVEDA
jgi:N utilization substance protein A